jgi:hypothetical protein
MRPAEVVSLTVRSFGNIFRTLPSLGTFNARQFINFKGHTVSKDKMIINDELETTKNKAVVAYFKVLFQH